MPWAVLPASPRAVRPPIELSKEQFSRGSDAWEEHPDLIFRFSTEETGGAPRFLVSAPAAISATKRRCVFIGRLLLNPWRFAAVFDFPSEQRARLFERYLKGGSGRAFLRRHVLDG